MKKLLSLLLAALLLTASLCTAFSLTASAAPDTKKRAIAVVFDNSGSMYMNGNNAWCRAVYSMEVFATMMNPNDEMYIYPMNEISVNGTLYTSLRPLKITQKTAQTIRSIYTTVPSGTPIESITHAYDDIQKKSFDEKWLIVLTDGNIFYKNDEELSVKKTKEELETVLGEYANSINTLYLGIGKAVEPEFSSSNGYKTEHKVAENSADVLKYLSGMCNTIFGRDALPPANINGGKISFDVSMSKLIVFIQGENIQNVKLGDLQYQSKSEMKYSTLTCEGERGQQAIVDTSLQGVLLTYGAVDRGEYELSYSGNATSVEVYYEPDVDLKVVLKDASGNEVDPNGELYPGEYTVEYAIVDRHGNKTESNLLGDTIYSITYTKNGEKKTINDTKNGSFTLTMESEDTLDSEFDVTYLGGYNLHRTGTDLGWPFGGLKFLPPPAGKLDIRISGGADSYNLTELENAEPLRVQFFYEANELKGEQLGRITVDEASVTGGNLICKVDSDEDGYFVDVFENASILDTLACEYTLKIKATYTNEDGQTTDPATAEKKFTVIDNSTQVDMTLTVEQDYYLIADLAQGKPFRIDLLLGTNKLTDDQLNQTVVTPEVDGIKFNVVPLYGESAFNVYIDPNDPPEDDSYEITFKVSTNNEIGRTVYDEEKAEIDVRHWPLWMRILIPILIILLIIALIVYFMTRKRLPKRLDFANCSFTVDGNKVPGKVRIDFPDGGKRRGSISITSPKYTGNPLAKAGVRLEVEAVTPRYVRSSQRRICVLSSNPIPKPNVSTYKVGTASYTRDTGAPGIVFIKAGSAPNAKPKPFNIGNNSMLSVSAELMDGTTVTLSGNIKTL